MKKKLNLVRRELRVPDLREDAGHQLLAFTWGRYRGGILSHLHEEVGFVHRNNGGLFDVVPWPSHEVIASAIDGNLRWNGRPTWRRSFYDGTDGDVLVSQPPNHRQWWSEDQWTAFYEHIEYIQDADRQADRDACAWVVKQHDVG